MYCSVFSSTSRQAKDKLVTANKCWSKKHSLYSTETQRFAEVSETLLDMDLIVVQRGVLLVEQIYDLVITHVELHLHRFHYWCAFKRECRAKSNSIKSRIIGVE